MQELREYIDEGFFDNVGTGGEKHELMLELVDTINWASINYKKIFLTKTYKLGKQVKTKLSAANSYRKRLSKVLDKIDFPFTIELMERWSEVKFRPAEKGAYVYSVNGYHCSEAEDVASRILSEICTEIEDMPTRDVQDGRIPQGVCAKTYTIDDETIDIRKRYQQYLSESSIDEGFFDNVGDDESKLVDTLTEFKNLCNTIAEPKRKGLSGKNTGYITCTVYKPVSNQTIKRKFKESLHKIPVGTIFKIKGSGEFNFKQHDVYTIIKKLDNDRYSAIGSFSCMHEDGNWIMQMIARIFQNNVTSIYNLNETHNIIFKV